MNKMIVRFIMWFAGIGVSFATGLYLDRKFMLLSFPVWVKILAGFLMLVAVLLLARSGRLLRKLGKPDEHWGWTSRFVTKDLYECLRHPYHLGIGLFVTAFSTIIGGLWTQVLVTIFVWTAIFIFLTRVEEPELLEKFGQDYVKYKEKTPMIFPSPRCIINVFLKNISSF